MLCTHDQTSPPHRLTNQFKPNKTKQQAVWYEAAAGGSAADEAHHLPEPRLSALAPVRLRSVHSKQASVIRFCNKSGRDARALWVDFDGNEVAYSVVEPGATRLYRTYATHPWIVREAATGARMLVSGAAAVVGTADEQAVDITDPPALAWAVRCCGFLLLLRWVLLLSLGVLGCVFRPAFVPRWQHAQKQSP
jgi:hypothetical protein